MANIFDGDFTVRLMNCAKRLKVTTIEELEAKLNEPSEVYIPGSLIASQSPQYYNKKRILEELKAYQECILDREPEQLTGE